MPLPRYTIYFVKWIAIILLLPGLTLLIVIVAQFAWRGASDTRKSDVPPIGPQTPAPDDTPEA